MNIIYIKLGIGSDFYANDRLGLRMDLDMPIASLNYDDMDSSIIDHLNNEYLLQISESEYYNLFVDIVPQTPVNVNTNYLITLTNYVTLLEDGDALFILRAGTFYKVSWDTVKNTITSKPSQLWKVGALGKPQIGDEVYTDDILGKDVSLLVNSLKIYPITAYDEAELPDLDYFIQDKISKTLTRPAKFKGGELIEITQL